ncbi:MAG: exodeoxyribonuclease VII small subunit [archaeon]
MDFEKKYDELNEQLDTLEKGNLGLDETMEVFRKGKILAKECREMLDIAEEEVNKEE